jgi:hypothetical protein
MTDLKRIRVVLTAVEKGTITQYEADAYLRATCHTTYEEAQEAVKRAKGIKTAAVAAIFLFLVMIVYLLPEGPTGYFTYDVGSQLSGNTFPINVSIIGLNATGVLYGEGNASIYFDTEQGSFLVGTIMSDTGAPRTDRASYALGEEVNVEHAPAGTYYFDDGIASTPVSIPFNATGNGTLLIVPEGTLTTYRLPIIIGDVQRVTAFSDLCTETCSINATNGTLRFETSEGATLSLENVDVAVLAENQAPVLTVPFDPLTLNGPTTIDLGEHFIDADGDDLQYAAGSNEQVNTSVENGILTLTPLQPGTSSITIYASDLQELVPATILVTVPAEPPIVPEVVNTLLNGTNETIALNITNATLDCSAANLNDRPEECLLENASLYFPEQDIYWETPDREKAARFTVIGNLLIKGAVIENAAGQPASRDFALSYVDNDLNNMATIWIDEQGNLYLRGALYEENANLEPPAGAYTIATRRGIYLAYADIASGNLHVRGNVIPYRRSIE